MSQTAPAERMLREIFVPARGQYDNIGDILLRRQLLDWLRESGPLHIYVGEAPDGYAEGLGLTPDDVQYRSFWRWYAAALRSAARGQASYVFKPGEIQLTLVGMKEHLAMLPVLALVRARHGRVARVGVGSRNFAPLPRALMGPSIALSNVSLWRDAATAGYLGRGSIMPDLAFAAASSGADPSGTACRDVLVVSMRSDVGYPSAAWLAGVRAVAADNGLQIWCVTQVLRDDNKCGQLAADLGGQSLRWNGTGHDEQEQRLRALYQRAALAVSDRLHVLIGALTEGAVPAALLVDARSDKIARHFAAAGLHDVSIVSAGLTAPQIAAGLQNLLGRRVAILTGLAEAQDELHNVRRLLDQVLTSETAR
ncbi:polysaccharide pyruvyl transferase family protein [Cryobacterium suzukii]|uniref:Polysaccharide pyruvyl transferase family protein n=1 Tax=Cryobacterium suzukii TaxID=1259198 RepID=A0A4R9AES1_9MICO|nr:polysaccharide pyruvyl transferase family protein [Cryobacterium suzukii]TFD59107.1 polysaccharide pyruvyl transferase family protein [Cryobacterium suzukii]